MIESLNEFLHANRETVYPLLRHYISLGNARWNYMRFHIDNMEQINSSEYLRFKEWLVSGRNQTQQWVLEVDPGHFSRGDPRL